MPRINKHRSMPAFDKQAQEGMSSGGIVFSTQASRH